MSADREAFLLGAIQEAVVEFDNDKLILACHEYSGLQLEPRNAVFKGLVPGMLEVGKLYEEQIYFIPEMLMCADTLYKGLEIFQKSFTSEFQNPRGKILIGVVEGDIHDIGKNLVKLMFEISGFQVDDLGRDISMSVFIDTALKEDYDLICASSMMSTTMYEMKLLIKELKEIKPDLKVMIGGSPVTKLHAIKWHADAYAPDAQKALTTVQQLLNTVKYVEGKRVMK